MATNPYENVITRLLANPSSNIVGDSPVFSNPYLAQLAQPTTGNWASAYLNNLPTTPETNAYKAPLWKQALGTLGGVGSMVTDSIATGAKGVKDVATGKDSIADFFGLTKKSAIKLAKTDNLGTKIAKAQWKEWNDGNFGWNDIPALGTLNLTNEVAQHGSDVLSEFGVKNKNALRWGGLGVDILADPLTWATLGATGAMKTAGKTAALAKASELGVNVEKTAGKALGFIPKKTWDVGKIADQVGEEMAARTGAKFGALGAAPETLDATRAAYKGIVDSAVDAARGAKQNALFSVGVPFMDKIAIGEKPAWARSLARTSEQAIGSLGGAKVASVLEHTFGFTPEQSKAFLKQRYGVSDAEKLTPEKFDDFTKFVDTFEHTAGKTDNLFQGIMKSGERINWGKLGKDGNIDLGAAPFMEDVFSPLSKTTSADILKNILSAGGKYSQGEVARRAILPSWANARSLGTKNSFLNRLGSNVQRAKSQISGRTKQLEFEKQQLADFIQKNDVTTDELTQIPYIMEGKLPDGFKFDQARLPVLEEVAKRLSTISDRIGKQGKAAGSIDRLRPNYFAHVMGKNFEAGTKARRNISAESVFNKERKSFETMADLDNAVAGLEQQAKAAEVAGDLEKAAELRSEAEHLSNLFERDAVVATFERAREGVRKSAMAELSKTFFDNGAFRRNGDGAHQLESAAAPKSGVAGESGYVTVSGKEARSLGLNDGDMVHKEVMEALKKVDNFLDETKMHPFFEGLQSITNIWRAGVTTVVPAHYYNNFIGNVFNNTLAGVRLKDYQAAGKIIKNFQKGNLTEAERRLMQEAIDHDIFGHDFTTEFKQEFGEVTTSIKPNRVEPKGLKKAEEKVRKAMDSKWTPWVKLGQKGDTLTRMANFLHGKATLGSAEKAADQVRTYLFNYNEMTKADKAIRLVVPFWNWTKNNLPLQAEQLFRNTRIYQTQDRTKNAWDEQTGAKNPPWDADRYWKLPIGNYGIPLLMPSSDLNQFEGNPVDTMRNLLSNINPIPKSMAELSLNKQFYTNKPIDWKASPNDGSMRPEAVLDYLLKQTGGLYKGTEILGSNDGGDALRNFLGLLMGKPYKME